MKEKKIEEVVEFSVGDDLIKTSMSQELSANKEVIKTHGNALDRSIINRARALYLLNDSWSIKDVAENLGISEFTLQDYCTREKWNLYKRGKDLVGWTEATFDTIYSDLDFYESAKEILKMMIKEDVNQNPKDMKTIIEAYKTTEERTTSLRLIRENAAMEVEEVGEDY